MYIFVVITASCVRPSFSSLLGDFFSSNKTELKSFSFFQKFPQYWDSWGGLMAHGETLELRMSSSPSTLTSAAPRFPFSVSFPHVGTFKITQAHASTKKTFFRAFKFRYRANSDYLALASFSLKEQISRKRKWVWKVTQKRNCLPVWDFSVLSKQFAVWLDGWNCMSGISAIAYLAKIQQKNFFYWQPCSVQSQSGSSELQQKREAETDCCHLLTGPAESADRKWANLLLEIWCVDDCSHGCYKNLDDFCHDDRAKLNPRTHSIQWARECLCSQSWLFLRGSECWGNWKQLCYLTRSRKASTAWTGSMLPLLDRGLSLLPLPGFIMITMTMPMNTAIRVVTM